MGEVGQKVTKSQLSARNSSESYRKVEKSPFKLKRKSAQAKERDLLLKLDQYIENNQKQIENIRDKNQEIKV